MFLISACLCGVNCKYNGGNNLNKEIMELIKNKEAILICPEQLGGMTTPREPHEIIGGTGVEVLEGRAKVVSKSGEDSTEKFLKGAKEVLKIAKEHNIKKAILKERSPSCGSVEIYKGSFNGEKIKGTGVAAELLRQNGIEVYSEENYQL